MIRYIASPTAVCKQWRSLSQLMRSRPSPTSSATPTIGIKSDDSIHSVFYRAVCELGVPVQCLSWWDSDPHLPALPHLRQVPVPKAKNRYILSCYRCLCDDYVLTADKIQTLVYQLYQALTVHYKRWIDTFGSTAVCGPATVSPLTRSVHSLISGI
jgi:hypothetical protein